LSRAGKVSAVVVDGALRIAVVLRVIVDVVVVGGGVGFAVVGGVVVVDVGVAVASGAGEAFEEHGWLKLWVRARREYGVSE